ncbi:MAG: hypothetical protein HFE64_03320 [Lachnospiraceae bacterium]|jgi:hypothetical protein|nr:hypothetical protein [Lachnospiraceae bacterium]
MKINVLGTIYDLIESSAAEDENLAEMDGYCDTSAKLCVVDDMKNAAKESFSKKNLDEYKNGTKRHELIHAFMYESGLDANSFWAQNEELVDWIALQFPKMKKAFEEAGCL